MPSDSARRPPPERQRFPFGLTLDEALQRGWRPGEGAPCISTDDGVIRERGPFADVVDLVNQPAKRRRRGPSSNRPTLSQTGHAADFRKWSDSAVAGIRLERQLSEDELPYTAIEHDGRI
jgi:hypothetical protein